MIPNSYSFLINHLNLLTSSKKKFLVIKYNKKMLRLIYVLKKIGYLTSFLLLSNEKNLVKLSPFFFKRSVFFKKIKLISTPSKVFYVKIRTLKLLNNSIGSSLLLLETSKGLVTHKEAIKLGVSGKLLCIIS